MLTLALTLTLTLTSFSGKEAQEVPASVQAEPTW